MSTRHVVALSADASGGSDLGARASGPETIAIPMPRPVKARVPWLGIASFVLMVLLPLAAVATYYIGIAASQYVSSARFTVTELHARPLAIADADETADRIGRALSIEEISPYTHVTANYLTSKAALADLAPATDVVAMFQHREADFWARLPSGASAEDLHGYWSKRVRVSIDGPSSIVTLHVRAFRPEDAKQLADTLLLNAEALLNRLAVRQKRDALARARAEATESDRRLAEATAALVAFREDSGHLDPTQEASEVVGLLSALTAERIRLESRLRVLGEVMDADAPRARTLRTQLDRVVQDMASLRSDLASETVANDTLAESLGRFEALEIRRRFVGRLYGLAQTRLIEAEIDLARQTVFLNLFDPPQLPEEPTFPKRWGFTLLATMLLFAGWATLALIWASVADHRLDRGP